MEVPEFPTPPPGGAASTEGWGRALTFVYVVAIGYFMAQTASTRSPIQVAAGVALLLGSTGLAWYAQVRRPATLVLLLCLTLEVACGLALWAWWPESSAWLLLLWVTGSAGGTLETRIAVVFAVCVYVAFVVTEVTLLGGFREFGGSLWWTLLLFGPVFVVGVQRQRQRRYLRQMEEMVRALRSYSDQLAEAHRQLQAEALQTAALAAAEERNRIAREIHDVLAHSLTIIVIQAQAIKRLVRSDPGVAEEQADTVARLARDGLQEARRSVSTLRAMPAGVDGLATLRALVEGFGGQTQTMTSLAVVGDANALSPNAWTTLYRVTQEALTNARRHGQAHQVDVRLAVDGSAHLVVADDGAAPAASAVTAGNGLTGMAERVARLGGSLSYGPRAEGGFRVEVDLPL